MKLQPAASMQQLQELVSRAIDGEGWAEGGEQQVSASVNSLLETRDQLGLHYLISALLRSEIANEAILGVLSADSGVPQLLQEAILDAVEALEQEREDVKEVEDELRKELGMDTADASSPSKALELVRLLLEKGIVQASLAAHILDPAHLEAPIQLLNSRQKFAMRERRIRTGQFYKQKKYNLLRECSEGWARLMVVLDDKAAFGPGGDVEDPQARRRRAKLLWKRIMAIIGCFDLSPNRVLDLMLDAFCDNVLRHWRFFLDLLGMSIWAAPTQTKGKERALSTEFVQHLSEETGNSLLTQILGFKFAHYQVLDIDLKGVVRTVESTPMELVFVTAILMREGFVRMIDILPYLGPSDTIMDNLDKVYKEKMRDEIRNLSGNALTQSVLRDDDDDAQPATEDTTAAPAQKVAATSNKAQEQLILLCEALLAVGHLPPAFYLISRWPVIVQYSPTVAELLLRIVQHCIEPAYESVSPRQVIPPAGPVYRSHFSWRETKDELLSLTAPTPLDSEKRAFKFFFSDWTDRLQRCERVEDVISSISPVMAFCGALGARDVSVLVKLCRIGTRHLELDASDANRKAWSDLIRTTLLPSMPLLASIYAYNDEIWPLLEPMSYSARYALYGEWHVAMTRPGDRRYNPAMAVAAAKTMNDAKQILKRMTSDVDRAHARAIGKSSYSAPTAMWSVILPQIMSYQNMRDTVVKAARYMSKFGWDVTVFMLLDALSDPTKSRVKEDGLSASAWLQSVATFIGEIASKHAAMDLKPVIQQIANQLKTRSLADLITLKQLISNMSGIDPLENVSKQQIECFSGGPILFAEGANATRSLNDEPPRTEVERTAAERSKKQPKKRAIFDGPTKRLAAALADTNMTLPILVAIAQARKSCIFTAGESSRHTKQLALSFDETHGIFQQYCRFLATAMAPTEYEAFVPTLKQLDKDFELEMAVSFEVLRPKLSYQIHNREAYLKAGFKMKKFRESLTDEERDRATWSDDAWERPLLPTMVDIAGISGLTGLEPFAATFWAMTLPELELPEATYQEISDRLKSLSNKLTEWSRRGVALNDDWARAYGRDRDFAVNRAKQLAGEIERQREMVKTTRQRLDKESRAWFPTDAEDEPLPTRRRRSATLFAHCFYPRAVFSPIDAVFVAKFARLLHDLGTPGFSLLMFYEDFLGDGLAASLFACTELEAQNLGRCLHQMLQSIESWRIKEEDYMSQAITDTLQGMRVDARRQLAWDKFRLLCGKWQRKIFKAVQVCLSSPDYMHVKNGVSFARTLIPFFPRYKAVHNQLKGTLRTWRETEQKREEPREDLVMAVKSFEDALTIASRDKHMVLIRPDAEFKVPPPKSQAPPASAQVEPEVKPEVKETEATQPTTVGPQADKPAVDSSEPTQSEPSASKEIDGNDQVAPGAEAATATPIGDSDAVAIQQTQEMKRLREELARSRELKAKRDQAISPAPTPPAEDNDVKPLPTGPKGNGAAASDTESKALPTEPRKRDVARTDLSDAPKGPRSTQEPRPASPKGMRSDAMLPPPSAPAPKVEPAHRRDDRPSRPASRAGSPDRVARAGSVESHRSSRSKQERNHRATEERTDDRRRHDDDRREHRGDRERTRERREKSRDRRGRDRHDDDRDRRRDRERDRDERHHRERDDRRAPDTRDDRERDRRRRDREPTVERAQRPEPATRSEANGSAVARDDRRNLPSRPHESANREVRPEVAGRAADSAPRDRREDPVRRTVEPVSRDDRRPAGARIETNGNALRDDRPPTPREGGRDQPPRVNGSAIRDDRQAPPPGPRNDRERESATSTGPARDERPARSPAIRDSPAAPTSREPARADTSNARDERPAPAGGRLAERMGMEARRDPRPVRELLDRGSANGDNGSPSLRSRIAANDSTAASPAVSRSAHALPPRPGGTPGTPGTPGSRLSASIAQAMASQDGRKRPIEEESRASPAGDGKRARMDRGRGRDDGRGGRR